MVFNSLLRRPDAPAGEMAPHWILSRNSKRTGRLIADARNVVRHSEPASQSPPDWRYSCAVRRATAHPHLCCALKDAAGRKPSRQHSLAEQETHACQPREHKQQ